MDVHQRTRSAVAQETRVFRVPLSSPGYRLDKFDAWSTGQHSFYDEPPVNCNIMALTVAPTLLTSARQQHLLHLPTLQLCGWEHAQTRAQMLRICHQEVFVISVSIWISLTLPLPHDIPAYQKIVKLGGKLSSITGSPTNLPQHKTFMFRSLLPFHSLRIAFTQTHNCHFSHKSSRSLISSTSTCRFISPDVSQARIPCFFRRRPLT